jgi:hypothetical protein
MTQINFTLFLVSRAGREDGAAVNRHQPNDIMTPELADLLSAFDDVATRVQARLADMERREAEIAQTIATINADQP